MRTHRLQFVVWGALFVATLALGLGALTRPASAAAGGSGKLKGQIFASDQPVPTLDDEDKVAETIRKWHKTTIEKPKDSSGWSFHILCFPDRKPGAGELTLIFTDVSDGKRSYLTSKNVVADAAAPIIAADVDVDAEDGFKPGMRVDVVLARVAGDKQSDLAKARLTFK